jgi:hypothetical protein
MICCAAIALAIGASSASTKGTRRTNAAPVTYSARVFMRGMKVTTPAGWAIHEDHPGEFNLASPPGALAGTNIHFWLDPIPTAPHGVVLPNVGRTPSALVAWLRLNRNFIASHPVQRRIAGSLKAVSVDLDVAASAPREDPGCPISCITYFIFKGRGYSFPFGTGHGELTRLYFATLGPKGSHQTFTVAVDTPSPKAFNALAPIASNILASMRLPKRVSAG